MRYIPTTSLKEGMICGKNLYDVNNQLLLSKGSIVLQAYIQRIEQLGYQGMYILDEMSEDIIVKDVISDELRMSAVKAVKDICIYSDSKNIDKDVLDKKIQNTRAVIGHIIEQLLQNKDTMVNLIDLKFFDDYTFFHSVNVAVLSVLIGVEHGMSHSELLNLGMSAILHDIGKVFIDKDILNKPDKLTPDEFKIMRKHPYDGYSLLKESYEVPTNVYVTILQHHERYDGLGYPNALSGEDILRSARIISVCDVYDALISKRPYRAPLLPSEAMEYIMANGSTMFDMNYTRTFARKVAPFPVGTYVRLSSGHSGIVYANYEDACMRPMVKVVQDQKGQTIDPIYVDLKNESRLRSVTIIGVNDLNTQL